MLKTSLHIQDKLVGRSATLGNIHFEYKMINFDIWTWEADRGERTEE